MKRFLRNVGIIAIVCVLVQCAFFAVSAKGDIYKGTEGEVVMTIGEKDTYVNGYLIENDVAPVIVNGRTMLPARFVAENLGAAVSWYEPEKKVTITKNTIKIELVVDSQVAYVNGREVKLDSPVFIKQGRTYTPVRFIVENLGATVNWLADTEQVIIYPDVSIVDFITEYYNENADSIWKALGKKGNAFLADLDDDGVPELCLNLGKNNGGLKVYKYKSGKVVDTKKDIAPEYGTGVDTNFELILDENGDIIIWTENDSSFGYSNIQTLQYIHEFYWNESKHEYTYRLEITQNNGLFMCAVNGAFQSEISSSEVQGLLEIAKSRHDKYEGMTLDVDNCSFTEIWEKQQENAESYQGEYVLELDYLSIVNLHYDYHAGSFESGFYIGASGTEEIIFHVKGPKNVKKVVMADFRQMGYTDREIFKFAKAAAEELEENQAELDIHKMPHGVGFSIPVYDDTIREDMNVLVIGVDENYQPIAYAVLEVFLG